MLGYSRFEGVAIQHVEHFKLVGHLHGRRTSIGIASDDVHAQALGGNGKFLAQFARAQKKDFLHIMLSSRNSRIGDRIPIKRNR